MSSLKFDEKVFEKLAAILKTNDLTEIEYNEGETKIRMTRQQVNREIVCSTQQLQTVVQNSNDKRIENEQQPQDYTNHPGAVTAKMVGTCYLAPEPGAKTFVEIGSEVMEGDSLLIIEAMKVMNIIKSPIGGKVVHIAVQDGEPVEFGQLLVVIE